MHRDASDLSVHDLALTGVKAGAQLEPEFADARADRARAPNRARRAVEPGEEAVAGDVELRAPETDELAPDHGMVARQELAPGTVAELRRLRRGANDVGEENGREHALRLGLLPAAGLPDLREKPFELVPDQRSADAEREVSYAGQLHESAARDL